MLTALALTWNFVACVIGVFIVNEIKVAAWFFAAIYFVIGIPGAWFTWCAVHGISIACQKAARFSVSGNAE